MDELSAKSVDLDYHRFSLCRDTLAIAPTCSVFLLTIAVHHCVCVSAFEKDEYSTVEASDEEMISPNAIKDQ